MKTLISNELVCTFLEKNLDLDDTQYNSLFGVSTRIFLFILSFPEHRAFFLRIFSPHCCCHVWPHFVQ